MRRPSHTTLVAYLALFLALGAGGAMAAGKLAKNSVGANQLKKNSVTGAKIKANAVTGAKVKDGSLTGSDLADGTITGAKVADGSLSQSDIGGPLRASNVMGIALTKECTPAGPLPAGVSASQLATGCKLVFGSSVLECAVTATVAIVAGGSSFWRSERLRRGEFRIRRMNWGSSPSTQARRPGCRSISPSSAERDLSVLFEAGQTALVRGFMEPSGELLGIGLGDRFGI